MSYDANDQATAVPTGYVSTHPVYEVTLTNVAKCRNATELELESRGLGVVEAMSNETVQVILNGEIDMVAIYAAERAEPV